MGQTSYIYVLWLVILVAGLWLIVGFGSTLHAREDLAGEWELSPEAPSAGMDVTHMKVEQSGRFLRLTLADRKPLQLKMIGESIYDQRFGEHKRIILTGEGAKATFEGRSKGDLWRLYIDGDKNGPYVAHLTDRAYPRALPATRPSALQTSPHGGATPRVSEITLQTQTRGVAPP